VTSLMALEEHWGGELSGTGGALGGERNGTGGALGWLA
jgi:hypothetical protein